jgi:hypothetical protein
VGGKLMSWSGGTYIFDSICEEVLYSSEIPELKQISILKKLKEVLEDSD